MERKPTDYLTENYCNFLKKFVKNLHKLFLYSQKEIQLHFENVFKNFLSTSKQHKTNKDPNHFLCKITTKCKRLCLCIFTKYAQVHLCTIT